MEYIGQIIRALQNLVIWWITIMPWEEAIHVRFGKTTKVLRAGLHLRIPLVDRVYVQTTRIRIAQCPVQTLTTKDGKTVTIVMNLGYSITDIHQLYATLYHADPTLINMMQGYLADEVFSRFLVDCSPADLENAVKVQMNGENFGLHFEYVKIVGFAVVRTYRIIQDRHEIDTYAGLSMDKQKT